MAPREKPHGMMAEFDSPQKLLEAALTTSSEGYTCIDAYSPFPIEGLAEAIGFHTRLPLLVLIGGLTGACLGFFLQWYGSAIDYPINVGGRPLNSWQAFIPITFEMTILFAGLTAAIGMLALNDFPKPYHPVFNVSRFEQASRDRFFLIIEASDPKYDPDQTRKFLERFHPADISFVEA